MCREIMSHWIAVLPSYFLHFGRLDKWYPDLDGFSIIFNKTKETNIFYCIIDNGSSILGFQNVLHKPNDGTKAVLSRRPFLCGEGVGPGAPLTAQACSHCLIANFLPFWQQHGHRVLFCSRFSSSVCGCDLLGICFWEGQKGYCITFVLVRGRRKKEWTFVRNSLLGQSGFLVDISQFTTTTTTTTTRVRLG